MAKLLWASIVLTAASCVWSCTHSNRVGSERVRAKAPTFAKRSASAAETPARPPRTVAPKAPAQPWVEPCRVALLQLKSQEWYTSGELAVGTSTIRYKMNTARGAVELRLDSEGKGDPAGWYWHNGKRENQHLRAEYEFASPEVGASPHESELTQVADECLKLGGAQELELESESGIVLEAPGLMLGKLDGSLLVLGRDHQVLIDTFDDRSAQLRPVSLPQNLSYGTHQSLRIHPCGNGDVVLSFYSGWAFGSDQVKEPRTMSWRRTNGVWGKKTSTSFVAGCGADWTLHLVSEPEFHDNMGDIRWSFQLEGTSDYKPPKLQPGPGYKGGRCPHRMKLHDVRAFPSGQVIAAGTLCGKSGFGQPAVETFSLGGDSSQFHRPGWLPGGALTVVISATRDADVDVFARGASEHEERDVHLKRKGAGWTPQPIHHSELEPLKSEFESQRIWLRKPYLTRPGELWRLREDKKIWQRNVIPRTTDPRVRHLSLLDSFETSNGDFWIVQGFSETDCGGCFQYRALVRVKAESWEDTTEKPW